MRNSFYSDRESIEMKNSVLFKNIHREEAKSSLNGSKDPLNIQSFSKSKSKIDPRVESFMSEVTQHIEQSKFEERMMKEDLDRKEQVRKELEKIREIEERILKQNKQVRKTLDELENEQKQQPKYSVKNKIKNKIDSTDEQKHERSSIDRHSESRYSQDFERQSQSQTESRLSENEVDTLITRIHEYYERMYDHDQNKFFDSKLYAEAESNHNIGRDLNLAKGRLLYSPKYKAFSTYK